MYIRIFVYILQYNLRFLCFLQRPTIDPCTTLPITGYYIHAIVTSNNEDANERIYTSKYIDDMLGGIMGEFSVSYNASFEQDLQPNANYVFIVNTKNNFLEISRTNRTDTSSKYLIYVKGVRVGATSEARALPLFKASKNFW